MSDTHSVPILSPTPSPFAEQEQAPERKGTEAEPTNVFEEYGEIIRENIEYPLMIKQRRFDAARLDEIVDLMIETVCTFRKTIRIAGDDYPAEFVKAKFLKLNSTEQHAYQVCP